MNKNQIETQTLLKEIINGIESKKGKDILSLDFQNIPNAISKYFVITHAESRVQALAIADSIEETLIKTLKVKAWNKEGIQNAEWILLDYVDIVVHIFQEETRSFYQLEDLWGDAQKVRY